MLCILGGRSVSDYLVFMPDHILSQNVKGQQTATDVSQGGSFPYFWTFFTSLFVEESLLILATGLMVINYVVYKNRQSFETVWQTRDFYVMLGVAALLSSMTMLMLRLVMLGLFRNVVAYKAYRYSGLNFIVMALLLGLR